MTDRYFQGMVYVTANDKGEPWHVHTYLSTPRGNVHFGVRDVRSLDAEARDALMREWSRPLRIIAEPVEDHPDDNLARRQILEGHDALQGTGEAGPPTDKFTICPECDPEGAAEAESDPKGRNLLLCTRHWGFTGQKEKA